MDFNDYDEAAASTAFYPESGSGSITALNYTVLGLVGEAGEVANKLKKVLRDSGGELTEQMRYDLSHEYGDILWYLSRGLRELGSSLEEAAEANAQKLFSRQQRGVLGGSGDNR